MATADNPPEKAPPVPSTYPNPVANNVNSQPMDHAYGAGAKWNQNDPVPPGLGNGSQPSHA